MQNFLRAYACKKLVRTANYGFASKWSGGGGGLDTRTKGWGEAGRNRDGAMEGFGLKFC